LLPLFVEEDETSLKFATIKFEGQFACGYLPSEKGKHHLVRKSPFNAKEL
jgi:protein subunit release factor B